VADELRASGDTVDFIAARQDYRTGQKAGGRMRREFAALARMLLDGAFRPRPDVIFSASSPPCLLVVATLLAWRHRAKSVHWAMDLYPEIAVALGEVRDGFLLRILRRLMGWAYRSASLVVALDGDMAERLRAHHVTARTARPWVVPVAESERSPPEPPQDDSWTWIYSGNLGRAHEWETLLEAQALLETRGHPVRLVFQGGGPSWGKAQARAEALGLRQCQWRDYVPETELRESLLRTDCCVVTQRPETRGLLWPSKLALVLSLPRRIVFVGPDGEIARTLGELPHAGVFAPGDARGLAEWIAERAENREPVPLAAVLDAAAHRADSLTKWRAWMRELSPEA